MIKVLQLGSSSGLYGAERWILSLIKYFDPSTIESHVAAIVDDDIADAPLCVEAKKLGFQAHSFKVGGRYSLGVVAQVRSYIRENGIQFVHSHGYKSDIVALLATFGSSCKAITTPHGWTQDPDFKLKMYEVLDRMIFPLFDAVVPLSEGLMDSLSTIPFLGKKKQLIVNGVDIGEIEALQNINGHVEDLKQNGQFVIGYIGRLVHGKGLDVLFKALSKVTNTTWKAILIGEGEQEEELKDIVEKLALGNRVEFLGFREDRLSLLKGFDAFVLPSRSEGIPRCIMEAMAAKVPVIASDIPGCKMLIDGKTTGMLFELDNAEDLAKKLDKVMENQVDVESFKQQAFKFLSENYSAKRMAHQYETLFLNL